MIKPWPHKNQKANRMSNDQEITTITPVRKTPVERVTERLMRDDPDTLLTEEDLKDIVGQAIQKVFFAPTHEGSRGSFSGQGKTGKSI